MSDHLKQDAILVIRQIKKFKLTADAKNDWSFSFSSNSSSSPWVVSGNIPSITPATTKIDMNYIFFLKIWNPQELCSLY